MFIIEEDRRTPLLLQQLTTVWEASVKATHLFLSDEEIAAIKPYVSQALVDIAHLIVAVNERGIIVAFMGIAERKLEMLFISPAERGQGLGKKLLLYGVEKFSVNEVCVNEQNPQALGFYEHMGFHVYKRTPVDEQGRPYPLLFMKLSEK